MTFLVRTSLVRTFLVWTFFVRTFFVRTFLVRTFFVAPIDFDMKTSNRTVELRYPSAGWRT